MDKDKRFYAAVVAFLAIIFALSYWVIQSGQQDTYTMLYFSNPLNPLMYNASENILTLNFTIENHENRQFSYRYDVSLLYEGSAGQVQHTVNGEVFLNKDEVARISKKIGIGEIEGNSLKVSIQVYKEEVNETYRSIWYEKMVR